MKKVLSSLILGAFVFVLTGCGGEEAKPTGNTAPPKGGPMSGGMKAGGGPEAPPPPPPPPLPGK